MSKSEVKLLLSILDIVATLLGACMIGSVFGLEVGIGVYLIAVCK